MWLVEHLSHDFFIVNHGIFVLSIIMFYFSHYLLKRPSMTHQSCHRRMKCDDRSLKSSIDFHFLATWSLQVVGSFLITDLAHPRILEDALIYWGDKTNRSNLSRNRRDLSSDTCLFWATVLSASRHHFRAHASPKNRLKPIVITRNN